MEVHGLEVVLKRNQFYWENYRRLSVFVFLLFIIILLLSGFVIYQRETYPTPKYFGTTPDGRPIPIVPLSNSYQPPEFVTAWATNAILDIYSQDFVTWRKTLQDAEVYFTQKGYIDFMNALKDSRNIQALIERKQVVSAEITGAAVLVRQGVLPDSIAYSWSLKIPATITYQNSANEVITQVGVFNILVERESTLRHPDGLAIEQLVFVAQ